MSGYSLSRIRRPKAAHFVARLFLCILLLASFVRRLRVLVLQISNPLTDLFAKKSELGELYKRALKNRLCACRADTLVLLGFKPLRMRYARLALGQAYALSRAVLARNMPLRVCRAGGGNNTLVTRL